MEQLPNEYYFMQRISNIARFSRLTEEPIDAILFRIQFSVWSLISSTCCTFAFLRVSSSRFLTLQVLHFADCFFCPFQVVYRSYFRRRFTWNGLCLCITNQRRSRERRERLWPIGRIGRNRNNVKYSYCNCNLFGPCPNPADMSIYLFAFIYMFNFISVGSIYSFKLQFMFILQTELVNAGVSSENVQISPQIFYRLLRHKYEGHSLNYVIEIFVNAVISFQKI